MIPQLGRFSRQEMPDSLRMSSLREVIKIKTLSLKRNILIFPQVSLALVKILILTMLKTQRIKTMSKHLLFKKLFQKNNLEHL